MNTVNLILYIFVLIITKIKVIVQSTKNKTKLNTIKYVFNVIKSLAIKSFQL